MTNPRAAESARLPAPPDRHSDERRAPRARTTLDFRDAEGSGRARDRASRRRRETRSERRPALTCAQPRTSLHSVELCPGSRCAKPIMQTEAMDTVLVTGGTGHLGRDLVTRLKRSCRVRVLARSAGSDPEVEWFRGDLATGDGIAEAVVGSQTVIHAATLSPAARRGYIVPKDLWSSPTSVDRDGTERLLDKAAEAGVGHILYVSIVGIDKPRVPYLRRKLEAESLIRQGRVPWSIARATQFHWLLDRMLGRMARLPIVPLPDMQMEPVDTTDFAAYLVESVAKGPVGRLPDFGGPEVLRFSEVFDQWRHVRNGAVRTVRVPLPSAASNAASAMSVTGPGARHGSVTWADWV